MTRGPGAQAPDDRAAGSAGGPPAPGLARARSTMREQALPLLLGLQRRLRDAGHRATTQDLLELDPPRLRLLVWPRPDRLRPARSEKTTLELAWGTPDRWAFSARRWTDGQEWPTDLASTPEEEVDAAWFERRALDFLEDVMSGGTG